MEIVIFEMFLFNEITGFFSKTGGKKIRTVFESLYKERNFGVESGVLWKQRGFDFSYHLIFFIISRLF